MSSRILHVVAGGKLMTVFSAPDYPQFQADGEDRYNNVAAVAVLSSPGYHEPRFVQYSAVLPRPAVSLSPSTLVTVVRAGLTLVGINAGTRDVTAFNAHEDQRMMS